MKVLVLFRRGRQLGRLPILHHAALLLRPIRHRPHRSARESRASTLATHAPGRWRECV
ncbi:predicted protein [Plenodomus lingam JN3]|uniref:Predicted protein n=1 Tax=Leptosphaeria maculans (strain JN3 / isolate v23.1.3 / race Av1-4-5-6-7-8) TaxID=985895 RepID=E4ZI02_LEPMJ|nr:predicted protein [Plenodomus lingam JN3]CBX91145.1 predicted protein [Plenodomus lingam JN3]